MKAKVLNERLLVSSILCVLPIVIGLLMYDQIPETMPIHWDSQGNANGFMPKNIGIWAVPLFLLAIHLIVSVGVAAGGKNQQLSKVTRFVSYWSVPIASILLESVAILKAAGREVNIYQIVLTFVGIIFVVAGNYLPKNQPNIVAGYRLPWTVNDVNTWKKTHLFAGKIWIVIGLVLLILSWTEIGYGALMAALIIVALLVPAGYSFIIARSH